MNIISVRDKGLTRLTEYFDFNQIEYKLDDLWNPNLDTYGRNELTSDILNNGPTLLILSGNIFLKLCRWEPSVTQLIKFCSKNNKIWVWDDIDSLIGAIANQKIISKLDSHIPCDVISIFVDGEISNCHPLTELKNIQIKTFPYNFFLHQPRIQNAIVNKHNCSRDFMLTTVKKPGRTHRDILWNQLNAIDGLIDCGYTNYGLGKTRIGQQSHQHNWSDGHPSMDLYQDSWLEIVPETLYQDGYFITEKTVKPIATKTPFLTVSTRFYIEYLQKQGFQTFGNIIDESYDQQPIVEDRIRLMLEQLQDIIHNGSEEFYKECASVLEHNQNRLLEINGRKQYVMDVFIAEQLHQLGIK